MLTIGVKICHLENNGQIYDKLTKQLVIVLTAIPHKPCQLKYGRTKLVSLSGKEIK